MSPINFFKRLCRPIFTVRVKGTSMMPLLIPNRLYFASSLKQPASGQTIVFKNPKNQRQILVKKIQALQSNKYRVSGTLSWGTSSQEIGLISPQHILGTLL